MQPFESNTFLETVFNYTAMHEHLLLIKETTTLRSPL